MSANNNLEKPSAEAKALSLFLMAHKNLSSGHKDDASLIKELWSMVVNGNLGMDKYLKEVHAVLAKYGGYAEVIEKTVKYYIDKTGAWKAGGEGQYATDAQAIADKILGRY